MSGTLLPEILGFHPQLLLDDIVNAANGSIYECVEGVSDLMTSWLDDRKQDGSTNGPKDQEELSREIDQGLVALQTLLESHVDLAFDYFEVWSLRNIFMIPPELPIVVPHQRDLDLHPGRESEAETLKEIEELRKELQNRRRLNYLLRSALSSSRLQNARSHQRLESVSVLPSQPVDPMLTQTLSSIAEALPDPILPDPDIPLPQQHDPSKRPWEQSKIGYGQWAVKQLFERAKRDAPVDTDYFVSEAQNEVYSDANDVWLVHGATEAEKAIPPRKLESVDTFKEEEYRPKKKTRME